VLQAGDGRGEVVLGIEAVGAAVGQQGVDERVVGSGLEAAVEEPILHSELGGADAVFDVVVVEGEAAVFEATLELGPFAQA